MNEELIKKALEYLNSAEAFASKEIPAYIQELLEFKFFEHLVNYFDDFLITVPLFILGLFLYKLFDKISKDETKYNTERSDANGFKWLFVVGGSIALLMSLLFTNNLIEAYKIKKAPRVYMVEYFKNQVK